MEQVSFLGEKQSVKKRRPYLAYKTKYNSGIHLFFLFYNCNLFEVVKRCLFDRQTIVFTLRFECRSTQTKRLGELQNRAMRIILHQVRRKCTQEMRNELKLLTLNSRRRFLRFICILKILHNLDCPDQSRDIFKFRRNMHDKDLRDKTLLDLWKVKSAIGQSMYKYAGAKDCNSLPSKFREITSIISFKRIIYTYLLEIDNNSHICSL